MKLEEQKEQERATYQNKDSNQDYPERIIVRIFLFCRRYFFGATAGTIHVFITKTILYRKTRQKKGTH
ncbi:MAG: hypothetical protein JSV17_12530 [Candidatus Aminicenantes bacterium]|nr:MAG: hypothetical protein JSV17_12530 [Candidatus Aminicenantes bacterium]